MPQYFRALGIPLLRGRDLEDSDTYESAYVAIVSESFVDKRSKRAPSLRISVRIGGARGVKARRAF